MTDFAAGAAPPRTAPQENTVWNGKLVRHSAASRVIHWTVALFFFLALFTGMPIWSPIFSWMGNLMGGLHVCRWLHPWVACAFFVATIVMWTHWHADMKMTEADRGWFGPKLIEYLKFSGEDPNVGKYNGGQKLFFWFALLDAILLLLTGIVLWFSTSFGAGLREASILLHDVAFILFGVAIVAHIYLGTAAEPGTFTAMSRGTVSKAWARLHHGKWYREVTGEEKRR
ncbi:MAG: formate dehydrogenase subunit gamma [Deltaproteobacteria bacterium]|nr:MAG: formate dehydrogenase subunit gamma [Deltaproteobacteria bacterium]